MKVPEKGLEDETVGNAVQLKIEIKWSETGFHELYWTYRMSSYCLHLEEEELTFIKSSQYVQSQYKLFFLLTSFTYFTWF